MHVAGLEVEVRIPMSHSLKEKRAVVTPILEGARRRYRVAAAEVDHLDQWQRSVLGFSAVGGEAGHVAEVLGKVERFVWSFPEVEVVATSTSWAEHA